MKTKISQEQINEFFSCKTLAIAGVSRDPKKFSNTIYNELSSKGYTLYPINPEIREFNGKECFHSAKELPATPDGIIIVTNKTKTLDVLNDAIEKGIRKIWIQQMSETEEVKNYISQNNLNIIYGKCVLMYLQPVKGFHNFHRFIMSLFGKL